MMKMIVKRQMARFCLRLYAASSWFVLVRFFGVWPSEVQMQVAKCDLGGCDWFFMAKGSLLYL